MIKPHDLMALAERLAAVQQEPGDRLRAVQFEPEGRAAVSRAYYSAFHAAKALIEEECGVVLPEGPESHEKLRKCLLNSANQSLSEVGRRLGDLRLDRNRADYKLSDSKFAIVSNVQFQLSLARQIVAGLTALQSNTAEFRASVRKYAKGTLQLVLRNSGQP